MQAIISVLFVGLLLSSAMAVADESDIPDEVLDIREEYLVHTWTRNNGLPNNQVNSILQTQDGYIWAATRAGLARFDGIRFTVFNRANTPAMEDERCSKLVEDKSGALWVQTEGGVLVRDQKGFKMIETSRNQPSFPNHAYWLMTGDATQGVWISLFNGNYIYHYAADRLLAAYLVPLELRGITSAVIRWANGQTWFGSAKGGFWLDAQCQLARPMKPLPTVESPYRHAALFDSGDGEGGYDLVSCWEKGYGQLYRIERDEFVLCFTNLISNLSHPLFLSKDNQGNLWMPLNQIGLLRWSPSQKTLTKFRAPLASTNDSVLAVHPDRDGNLWLGTVYGGLHCLQPRKVHTISLANGLAGAIADCLLESVDGSLWIGTENGLTRWDHRQSTHFGETNGLSRPIIRSLAQDRAGRLWVGTLRGLYYLQDSQFKPYLFPSDWEEGKIRTLRAAQDGGLWVGTVRGLKRIYQGQHTKLAEAQGLSHGEVTALLEDRSGILWVGTAGGGLNRLEWPVRNSSETTGADPLHVPPRITILSTTNGLSHNYIRALHQDADGILWVGTDRGLNRCEQGHITVLTPHQGLLENQVNEILEDEAGHFWISGDRSLCRVPRSALNAIAAGQTHWATAVEYDLTDGLPSQNLSGSVSHPASCRTRDGRLWFGTDQGVAIFDPRRLPDLSHPPLVVLEQVRINGRIFYDNGPSGTYRAFGGSPDNPLVLPPGSGQIWEIQYAANTFIGPEKTRFKYRLMGLAQNWTEAGNTRKAYFNNLRPGTYRFEVLAANKHEVWSAASASFCLVLEPFYYQTWWFYLTCGAAVLLVVGTGIAWRLQELRRLQQLQRQVDLDAQRKRIARDIHDELGASLTQIAQLSEETLVQDAPARAHIHRIASLAKEAVDNIGEVVWVNNPRYDTLEDMVAFLREYAAQYLGAAAIDSQLSLPDNVPSRCVSGFFRRHLLAIVKECLQNIVKHSGATQVALTLTIADQWLELTVQDNGCGMDVAAASQSGNGLVNLQERLAELKGSYALESTPRQGATLRFKIPLPPSGPVDQMFI